MNESDRVDMKGTHKELETLLNKTKIFKVSIWTDTQDEYYDRFEDETSRVRRLLVNDLKVPEPFICPLSGETMK